MRRLCFACFLAVILASARDKRYGLDGVLAARKTSFLGLSQRVLFSELNEKCGLTKIQWGNEKHTQARYAKSFTDETITFCGYSAVEVIFDFTEKLELDSCQISIYNRGDCGAWAITTKVFTIRPR